MNLADHTTDSGAVLLLHKIDQVVEKEDCPAIRGMIRKVHHLVTVID